MSGPRDRLGLLLPLPALLFAGAAHARIPAAPGGEDADPAEPSDTQPSDQSRPPPSDAPDEARALYEHGRQAFDQGDYHEAGEAFERAAALAPDLVVLSLDATLAFGQAAQHEPDPDRAAALCSAVQRNAEAVIGHPQASPEHIEQARAESVAADEHCTMLMDPTPETHGPCLSPPWDHEPSAGCGHRRHGAVTMLGGLMLLGLRSRRRRDAVERMADRLPPDVAARLRRPSGDASDDE